MPSKKIALIGAGFSASALAFYLLKRDFSVTLFDKGGGASRAATGLLHPFPGKERKLSWRGLEALESALALIAFIEKQSGQTLIMHTGIEREGSIAIGHTLFPQKYLSALHEEIKKMGGLFASKEIHSLEELKGFDQIVVAAGYSLTSFFGKDSLRYTKGQSLLLGKAPHLIHSLIAEEGGHLSPTENEGVIAAGSTYERIFSDELPNSESAKALLYAKLKKLYRDIEQLPILDCRAGIRVSRKNHYFPLVARGSEGVWAFGAMGSRGLLYHSYLAEILARAIEQRNEEIIPREVRSW